MISRPRGSVTIPRFPRGIGNFAKFAREVIQCLQQLRDRVVVTRPGGGGGGGSSFSHPFKITVSTVEDAPKYKVSKGSIILGTNGDPYPIPTSGFFDTERDATANFLVLEATVLEDLALPTSSNPWAFALVAEADTKEVVMTTSGTIRQNKIRLLIGKLTLDEDEVKATAWQAQFSSVRVVHAILNGVEVLVLENAPTHPYAI